MKINNSKYVCLNRLYALILEKLPCDMVGLISRQRQNKSIIFEAIVDQSLWI
jgi:hypothetical protein